MSSLKSIIKKDVVEAKKLHFPWWVYACVIAGTVFIGLAFEDWGARTFILPLLDSIAVIVCVVLVKWKARKHA